MNTCLRLIAVSALLLCLIACGKTGEPEQLEVRLDRWVVLGEDLHITFTMPMAEADKLSTTPLPELSISPPLQGTFAWVSPTEVVFKPAKDEIKIGVNYSVSIKNAVPLKGKAFKLDDKVVGEFMGRYFEMAGKVADWPVTPGNPGLVDYVGWHTGQIGQGPLLLLYDQSIAPEKLTNLVQATHDGRPLRVTATAPAASDISFNYALEADHIVAVRISNLPQSGETIHVRAPSWKDPGSAQYREWDFNVNRRFYFELSDSGDWQYSRGGFNESREMYEGGSEGGNGPTEETGNYFRKTWQLSFNNPASLEEVQAALKVDSPDGQSVDYNLWGSDYNTFSITVLASPGRKIRLALDEMIDSLGNPLEKKLNLTVAAPDLPPELFLPRSPLVVESKGNTLPVKFMNIGGLKVNYQVVATPVDYIKLLNKTLDNVNLRNAKSKSFKFTAGEYPLNVDHQIDIPLETVSSFQLVSIEAQETGSQARNFRENKLLVHSSDIAVTSKIAKDGVFVWVTAIAKPAALRGAVVTLYDGAGTQLARETTDASGTALLKAPDLLNGDALGRPLYVTADYAKATGFSQLVETELASAWQFRLPKKTEETRFNAVIFSDRGVYRSGDTVHLKIIADVKAAAGNQVTVVIRDSRGREAFNSTVALDDFSSAACDFTVKPNAPVGEYTVYAERENGRATYGFQVEEYRTPAFVVNVSGQREEWKNDDRNYGRIKAEYTKGGALAGRDVTWRVYRQRVPFTVKKLAGYVFGLEGEDELNGNIADGEGKLNDAGEMILDFSIASPVTDSLMLYVLQGTVTDMDRQTYSGAYSAVVHPADYYAGVKPPIRDVVAAGDDILVPVVVTDRQGNPVPDVKVSLTVEDIQYHTNVRQISFRMAQLDTRAEYSDFETAAITSQKAPVQVRLNIGTAGYYRVVCAVEDGRHRTMRTGFKVTVSGDNPTAWPRFDKEQIELIADKDKYREGENANLVTMSPYQNALGLLTLEKDGAIVYKKTFVISNNTPAVQFPVKAEYAPNVYASVVIVRGREHYDKDATGFETGAPGFKIGYTKIDVDPVSRRLTLAVAPVGKNFHPGETVTVNLECKDQANKPVAGQVTLAVVDEAVLSLTGFRTPDPLAQLIALAPLGIRTGSNLLDLPNSRRSRHETLFEGGGDDLSGYVEPGKVLRNLFMSTAYWNPAILLDKNGRASVQFKLPDNITGYRLMGVVADARQRMGSGQERITSKKPLMIMPVLPRFVYSGDQFTAEARVFNETGVSGAATVKTVLSGVDLMSGKTNQTKSIQTNGQEFFQFPVLVTAKDKVTVRFSAALGAFSDAAEYTVPVLRPVTTRASVRGTMIGVNRDATLDFDVPTSSVPGTLAFELTASGSALTPLADAVNFVMQYPHGCIEQTTSNAYPLIIFKDLLKEMGVSVDQRQLQDYTEAGIKRILTFLTPAGGLSYWPGEGEPHPYGTGFGALALVEARRQGYDVPPDAIARLGDYMERTLGRTPVKKGVNSYHDTDGDTLALYAAVLGRMGRPVAGYANILWSNNERLTAFGLSFLAVAIKESNGRSDLLANVLQALKTRIKEYDEEAYVVEQGDNGGYSLGSNIRSQGAALFALAAAGSENALATKLLNGLLKRRNNNGFWGNTQSTIFGIMGIHAYAVSTAAGVMPEIDVMVNGKTYAASQLGRISGRTASLSLDEGQLSGNKLKTICLIRNRGGRPAFASARLTYQVKLDKVTVAATANGFSIERSYETVDGQGLSTGNVPLGSLVLVRLKVKADGKANYVAIDDKLPAGFEPLNTNLKTTERLGSETLSDLAQKTLDLIAYGEVRDSRVFFYVNEMAAGEYEFTYYARATTAGVFLTPAARVEPMYDPDRNGTTRLDFVSVKK